MICTLLWPVLTGLRAEENPLKHASDFASTEYYDPPNQMQIHSRLSGTEAVPISDDTALIKNMRLEIYETNAALLYIVEAPECTYNQNQGIANSAGHLKLRQADGLRQVEGDGFLWRESDHFLYISNNQHTVIRETPGKDLLR